MLHLEVGVSTSTHINALPIMLAFLAQNAAFPVTPNPRQ